MRPSQSRSSTARVIPLPFPAASAPRVAASARGVRRGRPWWGVFAGAALVLPLVGACGNEEVPAGDVPPELPGAPLSPEDLDPEVLELIVESQGIQERLNALTNRVLSEEGLATELEALQARIDETFRERNPALVETMDRYQARYDEARAQNDEEAQRQIRFEVAEVQEELALAQQSILDDPVIATAIETFEARQRARMIEIEPEAAELFDRLEAVERELAARLGEG